MLVFPSKRDAWITITIAVADLLMLFATATMLLRASGAARVVFPLFFLGVAIFTGSMLVGTRYVIDANELLVQCGLLRRRIRLDAIRCAVPTDDPTSGPALSLDRIAIDYDRGGETSTILVSPADREAFIRALRERNAAIATE